MQGSQERRSCIPLALHRSANAPTPAPAVAKSAVHFEVDRGSPLPIAKHAEFPMQEIFATLALAVPKGEMPVAGS